MTREVYHVAETDSSCLYIRAKLGRWLGSFVQACCMIRYIESGQSLLTPTRSHTRPGQQVQHLTSRRNRAKDIQSLIDLLSNSYISSSSLTTIPNVYILYMYSAFESKTFVNSLGLCNSNIIIMPATCIK